MLEHYIEYEMATGAIITRGTVNAGTMAVYPPQPGNALLAIPFEALIPGVMDVRLDVIRPVLLGRVDEQAERFRLRFITPGAGQALTYQYKADEARRLFDAATADQPTPFLDAEAAALGVPTHQIAQEVLAQVQAWVVMGARIEGVRRGASVAIQAATETGPALVAATVDWDALYAPAA